MAADLVADFAQDIILMVVPFFILQALMHITIRMYGDAIDKPRAMRASPFWLAACSILN